MKTLPWRLSEEQISLLPSEEDVDFYEEHGWYISRKVLSDQVIDEAILGSERYYLGERDMSLPVSSGYSDWRPEDGDGVRNNEFVSLQNKELRRLALQPIIGAIASRLARTRQIRLLDDQLVYKPPGPEGADSAVGWHADRAYWATCSSDNLLTAWIPFHDCGESNGTLVVIDGSHKWPDLQETRFFNDQNLENTEAQFRKEERKTIKVPITLKKGQVSFHHCWTIHGSYPNHSNSSRLAMAVHLQDDSNRYRAFRDWKGQEIHMFDEVLCRKLPNGSPDFTDPKAFPVVWSEKVE